MPAVKGLIEKDDQLLFLRIETENDYFWVPPGGRVEYGESPEEALLRELEEEISVDAEIGEPIGMYHFYIGEEREGDQVVLTVFEAEIGEQEVDISSNPAEEDIAEYRWLEPRKVLEMKVNENLKELVEKNFV